MASKHLGTKFDEHLLESLRENDYMVFLHLKEALKNPDLKEGNDYEYLIQAINDVARARGKAEMAEKAGISRQALYKILNGKSVPSIQNIIAILKLLGLKFSVEQIKNAVSEAPADVLDVAEYDNKLLSKNSTTMKLQKIVYYAQVESIINYDKILFGEPIEAWAAGPVVKKLFLKHKGHRYSSEITFGDENKLSLEQKCCVDWAIAKYGNLDRDTLSHLTHIEDPWKNARGDSKKKTRSNKEITIDEIKKFYLNLPDYSELDEKDNQLP